MGIKNINIELRILIFIFFVILLSNDIRGQNGAAIKNIKFHGNDTISKEALINQMNTKPPSIIERIKFWKREPVFSRPILEADIERLHSFYQRNGFLKPHISYNLDKKKNDKKVTIHIHVKSGESIKIRNVSYSELKNDKKAAILSEIKSRQPFQKGQRFVDKLILGYESTIQEAFHDNGYPFIRVERQLRLDTSDNYVDIHFNIYPNSRAYFGSTTISGDSLVSENFIRKQLKFEPGELYSRDKIEKTQQKLFNTDLFQYVVLRPQKDQVKKNRIPVSVELQELPPWSLETGVGYGTEDRFRMSARLTKLQFLGGTRKFIFIGKRSHFLPVSLETKLIQPNVVFDDLDLIFNPFFITENEKSYRVDRVGGGLTFQKNFSPSTSGYLMYSLERDFLENKIETDTLQRDAGEIVNNKSGVTLGITRNTTQDPFNPAKGWKINGHFTYMGIGFKSRYNYYKSEFEVNRYFQLDKDWILAGKIAAGFIKPLEGDATPIEDRFLIGGASSLRGWGRHQISPVNEDGKLIGGNSMLQSSVELRFPIYDIFSGVAFVDAGNVWRSSFNYDLAQLRYDAGLGLRVSTPIGPVRLDVATPVLEGTYRLQFFLSIGHAF